MASVGLADAELVSALASQGSMTKQSASAHYRVRQESSSVHTTAQILLIHADDGPRRAAGWYLSRAGYQVATFASEQEALEVLGQENFFDVVVTDLRTGKQDAALLRACRKLN